MPETRLPRGLAGLAGLACVACCAVPFLIGAGALSGAGWIALGSWLPAVAVGLAVSAAAAWWWNTRRHRTGCAGGDCSCSG